MQTTPTKILVVDDEPDLEDLITLKFRRQIRSGVYEFAFAGDGVEALEKLEADPAIEIVLTDLNMPRMDGLTLLGHLSELERHLKAIVVSAYGDLGNIRAAMNRGAFDFLVKPIELDDLEITIRKSRDTVERERQALYVRQLFGRYLSDEVVNSLLQHPQGVKLGGEKRVVTLLMSDLRGFSTLTEQLPPEQVVEILNAYLGRMADIITRHNGTIDEYIGDAILAIFGAPILREDDALRTVACALEMQMAMGDVNEEMAARGLPPLEMGIGLNTGEVIVGNIGSEQRAKYGVVGSHVNLTSRIESYTVGGQVLITEHTLEAAGTAVQIGEQMQVMAKGFSTPINVFAVDGVGAPYDLLLPAQEIHMTPLPNPLPIRYSVLDGKHLTNAVHEGHLLRLSPLGALLNADAPIEQLENLHLDFPIPDTPDEHLGDLYAKVVDVLPSGLLKLRFTAIPQDVAAAIRHHCDRCP